MFIESIFPASQSEAREAGVPFYRTGKPCKRGHVCERRADTGDCVECKKLREEWRDPEKAKARSRKYVESGKNRAYHAAKHAANPDANRLRSAARRAKDPDADRARCRGYYSAHRDAVAESKKRWRAENPDIVSASESRRRARIKNAEGSHSAQDLLDIRINRADRCFYCGIPLRRRGHVDHYIPLARGGTNYKDNIRWSCGPCNMSKRDRTGDEFEKWLARIEYNPVSRFSCT